MIALLIIFIGAIVLLFLGHGKKEQSMMPLSMVLLLAALCTIPYEWSNYIHQTVPAWLGKYVSVNMLVWDTPALAFEAVMILITALVLALFSRNEFEGNDLPVLMLFSLCGGLLMAGFSNLVMLFLGIEVLSIPLYVLAASRKHDLASNEAGMKYFLMGGFSTAIFLLGCAFIYGATGTLEISSIARSASMLGHVGVISPLLYIGIFIIMAGLLFKVAAFPFHFWSPDVYEGSPNRTTVFMATIAKIAAFAAFFRLFHYSFIYVKPWWGLSLAVLSAATILVGNIGALTQRSMKRTLAYSSIAHAGYMLLAVLAADSINGFWALLVYMLAYGSSAVSVFYLLDKVGGDHTFERFNGFGNANRWASVILVVAMFSMAGIPLTAGFAGKYGLFSAVLKDYTWLIVIALLGSAISIAYYFRVFKNAFFTAEATGESIGATLTEKFVLIIATLITLTIGLWPGLITGLQLMGGK